MRTCHGKFPEITVPCPDCRCPTTFRPGEKASRQQDTTGTCPACRAKWSRTALAATIRTLCPTCGGILWAAEMHRRCDPGTRPYRSVVQLGGEILTRNRWYLDRLVEHGKLDAYLAGQPNPLAEFRTADREPAE